MDKGLSKNGFKRKTYNEILGDMESKAREYFGDNVNLSERSPLGMFLKAISWEIAVCWDELENSYLSIFATDAVGVSLDRVVSNFGRKRHNSTKSVGEVIIKGQDMKFLSKGFLVGTHDGILFETVEDKYLEGGSNTFAIRALSPGSFSNVPAETITNIINPTPGIYSVINEKETRDGSDVESDEKLRERHFLNLRKRLTGDNKPQYEVWARSVEGVGAVKVSRATPTAGYVTITITNASGDVPSQELLDKVYDYIDELRPVNAGIIVAPANAVNIDIDVKVKLLPGIDINNVKDVMKVRLTKYFNEVTLTYDYLSIAQIGKIILEIDGIVDYTDLKINGVSGNILFDDMDFPKLGTVALEVF